MRKARKHWQESCAVLAILVGLVLTGVSWADFAWPPNAYPFPTSSLCNSQTGDCYGWGNNCINKGDARTDNEDYTCANTVWNSLKMNRAKAWGLCNTGSGSCTAWGIYYCVYWYIYQNPNCDTYACDQINYNTLLCDPNNPTGQ